MLYDDYRKKMNKLKNVLDTVKRFRVPIIIVCAALIALIVTLMSVSGIVYDKTDCPAALTYGEELDYRAKAVLKSVRYEYAEENSDNWSSEKPVRAGSYKVRPVSKSVFGTTRYGKIHSFEILRKQTDISAALQTVYGDDPEVVADLAFSDKAICTKFDFGDITAKTTDVIPELPFVKILDKDGNDVTSSYELNPVQTQITFLPRSITVKADDAQKIYDGTPLTCDTYSDADGRLLSGHTLSAVTQGSQTDARVKGVNAIVTGSVKIYDANGTDVTHNYFITTECGTLEVTPRPIKISTGSAEKIYDGMPLICDTYSAENLVSGHTLSALTYDGKITAGTVFNAIKEESVKITAADGGDVTANYDMENIGYSLGTLTVTKRRLTVTAENGKFVYDGTPRQSAAHKTENLVAGHRTQGKASVSLTQVGTVKNSVTVTVYSGSEDVTANYDITYINGYLTVAPRPIILSAGSISEEYDGKAHTCGAYEVTSTFSFALVSGHKISAVTQGSQTEIGTGVNKIAAGSVTVTDADGTPVINNYDVTITDGKIEVTARVITVKADDAQKIYDGTPLTCSEVKDVNGKLLPGHTVSAVTNGSQTDADKGVNSIAAGSVIITDKSGADVTHYYSVTTEDGTLEVNPRPVKISTGSAEKVYDGAPLSCDKYNITSEYSPALVLSHEARIRVLIEYTDVIQNLDNYIIIDVYDGETKVTSNYFIEYDYGTLTVKPRPITVNTKGGEWEYDGKEHYNTDITVSGSGIVDGQSYTVDYYTFIVDAGEMHNRVWIKVYAENGKETTENYAITYAEPYGILKVTKRPLTVTSCSAEKVYDGALLTCRDAVADNLVQGHVLSTVNVGSQTNVGTSNNYISSVKITVDDNGIIRDVTKNYEIKYVHGTLTVTPRPVTVFALDASKVFDGAPLTCPKYGWVNIVPNHRVSANVTGVQIAVGSSPNIISDIAIYNGYRNVTANYDITVNNGTLTVTHGKLIIFTGSAQKQYDGTPLTCPLYYIDANSVIPSGFTYTVNVTGTITAVGVRPNTFEITVLDEDGNDVTENIEIERQLGLLKICGEGDESGGNIGGGGLDGSGGIGGSSSSGAADKSSLMMRLYSDVTGDAYLRYKSFGDYNGKNWTEAQSYAQLINGGYGANYLTSFALENSGLQPHTLDILPFTYDYTLPYYASADGGSYDVQSSDTAYNGNTGAQYSMNYYLYDYTSQGSAAYQVPSQYAAYESDYRRFVYQNYLAVPLSTREYLNGIIASQRFNRNDSQIVAKIARYVQRSAKYNLNYNSALDKSDDIVIAFLRDYKEGICSHYASAATLMFRALGIPARYTIGYKGSTSANYWTEVTSNDAHAWVEVYIDGTGWVYVEVTGGDGGNGDNGDGGNEGSGEGIVNDYTIVLRPKNEAKVYDGTPVYAKELVPDAVLEKLIELGYTYDVAFSGRLSYYGTALSEVSSFTLYDGDGNNVTDKFEYNYLRGKLTVAYNLVTVSLYNLSKEYDGTPLRYASDEFYTTGLPRGYSLIFDPSGVGRTDAGVIYADDLGKAGVYVLDEYGANVTSQFYVHFEGALVVTQRTVKLTANSDEKVYDGEAITNGGFFISGGSLVEGHSVKATVIGSITDIGAADNLILSAVFFDADGKNVSLNYFCVGYVGTLRVYSD